MSNCIPHSRPRFALCAGALTLLAISLAPAVQAQSIPVQNFSFETPVQSPGGFTVDNIPFWSLTTGTTSTFRPGAGEFTDPIPDGFQVAALGANTDASIAQQLGDGLQANFTYNLSVAAGQRSGFILGNAFIELYAGGTVSSGNVTGGILLGSTPVAPAPGKFVTGTVTFSSTAASPGLGLPLTIRLAHTGSGQVDYDNVRLNRTGLASTTPEPGAYALLASLGISGLGLARSRKRSLR